MQGTPSTSTSSFTNEAWAKSTNIFTAKLLSLIDQQLNPSTSSSSTSNKNVLVSGLSINAALTLASEGAKGQTLEQLRNALGHDVAAESEKSIIESLTSAIKNVLSSPEQPGNTLFDSFASVVRQLNKEGPNVLTMANALWLSDRVTIAQALQNAAQKANAHASTLPFASDGEGSRKTINDWVEQQTNNKIKDLIPPRKIHDLTSLIITNAVYFKAEWEKKFEHHATHEGDFAKVDGQTIRTKFMNKIHDFKVVTTKDAQVLELPYKGRDSAMYIILPQENTAQALRHVASAEVLGQLLDNPLKGVEAKKVRVKLPKFEISCDSLLSTVLKQLGITNAFDAKSADLTGLVTDTSGNELPLFIEEVFHKAFVKVDEEGTEAAAATALDMAAGCAIRKTEEFFVDRPFVFCIYHSGLKMALFTGIVFDPTLTQ